MSSILEFALKGVVAIVKEIISAIYDERGKLYLTEKEILDAIDGKLRSVGELKAEFEERLNG